MKSVTFESGDDSDDVLKQMIHTPPAFEHGIPDSIVPSTVHSHLINSTTSTLRANNLPFVEAKRLLIMMTNDTQSEPWKCDQGQLEGQLALLGKQLTNNRLKLTARKSAVFQITRNEKPMKTIRQANNINEKLLTSHQNLNEPTIHELLDTGTLKITIKDKPIVQFAEKNLEIMRWVLDSWLLYTAEAKRLRGLKTRIYQNTVNRILRRFFNTWKIRVHDVKQFTSKRKQDCELKEVKKIELFVNSMMDKKEKLTSLQRNRVNSEESVNIIDKITSASDKKGHVFSKNFINIHEPLKNRLNVQKKIIAEQRMKLAEQNRIIQDMKLKQIEEESRNSGIETVNAAKKVINNCRQKSPNTLIQLIQQKDYQNQALVCPPKFLMRMEARAAGRNERAKQLEYERQRKLEEKKHSEETIKKQQQEIQKQRQLEMQRQARLHRQEEEKRKALTAERTRVANESADNFYRKYLLRHYVMKPLILLVHVNHSHIKKASRHCDIHRLRKTFTAWKNEIKCLKKLNLELTTSIYNRNLLWHSLQQWIKVTKEEIRKSQVACDYYDLRLQEKSFNIWNEKTIIARVRDIENEKLSIDHYKQIINKRYFVRWRKYIEISDKVKESDKCREEWRQLVQMVIPNFAPKFRGVLIDD